MKVVKYSLTKQIVEQLENKISSGEYKVGSKIPTESDLIELFGVSRNTVREAVQALIHSGLLEARQGDGTYVIAKEKIQVNFYTLFEKSDKKQIEEVRLFLEKSIVELAIDNATQSEIDEIKYRLNERNISNDSIKEHTQRDLSFHLAIANATHNEIIINLYTYLSQYFIDFIASKIDTSSDNQALIDSLHNQLYTSIEEKNIEKAKKIISQIIAL